MNKFILSTLNEPINFNLSATRKLVIDPSIAISVTEEEYLILENRLGHQISVVTIDAPAPTVEETPVIEEVTEETPVVEEVTEETPVVEEVTKKSKKA